MLGDAKDAKDAKVGKQYNDLTVLGYYSYTEVKCLCICGNKTTVNERSLVKGSITSCGCSHQKTNEITIEGDIAYIHLPDEIKAIIDVDDIDKIKKKRWGGKCGGNRKQGEYVRSTDKIYLHRYIMNVHEKDPKILVDHINGNPLDNRKSNLQICDVSVNIQKAKKKRRIAGVGMNKYGRYYAYIYYRKKYIHLGTFSTKKEAALAYNKAAVDYFGKTAYQNEV